MTEQILQLRSHLIDSGVSLVVMESTSDYWKPFYYLLEGGPFELMLVNARHAKNMPGRKTDVSDAQWLAELGAHGLVRGSLVPPVPIRQLRDLTRTRLSLTADRSREINRLEKVLEDAGIKLSSVASDITGASARAMLGALIEGERDPVVLAELAKTRMRRKRGELSAALSGRFTEHHGFMVDLHLKLIDQISTSLDRLTARIERIIEPYRPTVELLTTIPGVSEGVAVTMIAKTGGDMSQFPTAAHLASWAGVCPGHRESAGKSKPTRTRPGNRYLKAALGVAAMGAARTNGCYLQARYKRITSRSTKLTALVALEHSIITATWHTITKSEPYRDLDPHHLAARNPQTTMRRIIGQANSIGMTERFELIEDTPT